MSKKYPRGSDRWLEQQHEKLDRHVEKGNMGYREYHERLNDLSRIGGDYQLKKRRGKIIHGQTGSGLIGRAVRGAESVASDIVSDMLDPFKRKRKKKRKK
ncbi:MAG: hypothetical protein ACTSRU_01835 [Candidatus Hodarchaeales archaeon]